jgi:hypothetical protein
MLSVKRLEGKSEHQNGLYLESYILMLVSGVEML